MMTCDAAREAIVLRAAGEIEADSLAALETHVRACAACAEEADGVRATLDRLLGEAAPDPGPAYWAAFGDRVRVRLHRTRSARRRTLFAAIAATALAAAALGVVGSRRAWIGRGPDDGGTAGTAARANGDKRSADGAGGVGVAGRVGEDEAAVAAEARLESALREIAGRGDDGRVRFEEVLDEVLPAAPLATEGAIESAGAGPTPGTS